MKFSESELRIIRRVLEGRSNSELAAQEGLEEAQVADHIAGVLKTLGLRQRIELIFYAATKEGRKLFQVPAVRKSPEDIVQERMRKSG